MIRDLNTAGAMPALEALMRFSGQRQRLIAHNVANLTTPGFQPVDVSPQAFQRQLAEAVDDRRSRTGGQTGELNWHDSREVRWVGPDGALELRPTTFSAGVLGHDRNNSDLERTMQAMVENASAFRLATELFRKQKMQLEIAIAERF